MSGRIFTEYGQKRVILAKYKICVHASYNVPATKVLKMA